MPKLAVVYLVLFLFTFSSCEKEATVIDFLSDAEVEAIVTGEDVETQTPINIAQVQSTPFTAVIYSATTSGNGLEIYFENEEGDSITLTVSDTENETYTAGNNSLNLFIGEVYYEEEGVTYTTDPAISPNSIGVLGLNINEAEGTVSGNFNFTAYNGDDFIEVISIASNFTDIPLN